MFCALYVFDDVLIDVDVDVDFAVFIFVVFFGIVLFIGIGDDICAEAMGETATRLPAAMVRARAIFNITAKFCPIPGTAKRRGSKAGNPMLSAFFTILIPRRTC